MAKGQKEVYFTLDDRYVFVSGQTDLMLWEVESGYLVKSWPKAFPTKMIVAREEVAVKCGEGWRLINMKTLEIGPVAPSEKYEKLTYTKIADRVKFTKYECSFEDKKLEIGLTPNIQAVGLGNTRQILAIVQLHFLQFYDLKSQKFLLDNSKRAVVFTPDKLRFENNKLWIAGKSETFKVVDFSQPRVSVLTSPQFQYNFHSVAPISDNPFAVFGSSEEFPAGQYLTHTEQEMKLEDFVMYPMNRGGGLVSVSPDKRYTAVVGPQSIQLIDNGTKAVIKSQRIDGLYAPTFSLPLYSKDSRFLYYYSTPIEDEMGKFTCWEAPSGKVKWEVTGLYPDFTFCDDQQSILVHGKNEIRKLNAEDGRVLASSVLQTKSISKEACFSLDAQKIVRQNNDGLLEIFDTSTGQLIGTISGQKPKVTDMKFAFGGKIFITTSTDNAIRFWNIENKQLLFDFYLFGEGSDWAAIAPDGRFEATNNILEQMYFNKGYEIIPLEQLSEKYYTPRLAQMLIEGISTKPSEVLDLKPAPKVNVKLNEKVRNLVVTDDIAQAKTTEKIISIDVTTEVSLGDLIAEIRVFHNGKLLLKKVNLKMTEAESQQLKRITFEISLLEGENNISVMALNAQKTASLTSELDILKYSALSAPKNSNESTLYLLVVGINNYKNPKYQLNYANADATALKDLLVQKFTDLSIKINLQFITDEKATSSGIMEGLDYAAKNAKENDIFVFYYAGHGVMASTNPEDKNPTEIFYLVPQDVVKMYGSSASLLEKGISAETLKRYAETIKAQKQLYILDACQSSGAAESLATRGASEEKAISQLSRSTGTHWLMASGSQQFASEFVQLGHGAFTYCLLEGLNGKADNGDKKVTVNELKAYLEVAVPETTKKYKGTPQYPSSFGFGQDFPLGTNK